MLASDSVNQLFLKIQVYAMLFTETKCLIQNVFEKNASQPWSKSVSTRNSDSMVLIETFIITSG